MKKSISRTFLQQNILNMNEILLIRGSLVQVQQGELKKKGLQKCSPFLFALQMRVVSPKARQGELERVALCRPFSLFTHRPRHSSSGSSRGSHTRLPRIFCGAVFVKTFAHTEHRLNCFIDFCGSINFIFKI